MNRAEISYGTGREEQRVEIEGIKIEVESSRSRIEVESDGGASGEIKPSNRNSDASGKSVGFSFLCLQCYVMVNSYSCIVFGLIVITIGVNVVYGVV